MLNRITKICFAGLIVALIALISISYYIYNSNDKDLYLIIPKNVSGQGIDIKEIEKINEEALMLTYVGKQQNFVTTGYTKHDITVIATNYTFPFVCGYQMINGGFFTRENQEEKNNYAVLNETAAYQMFGNTNVIGLKFTMNNKEYIVRGIINDDSKAPNTYIPMMLSDQNPDSFIIRTDERTGVSREYILNSLKQIDISDTNYYFTNIGLINEIIAGKAFVALLIFLFFILVIILIKSLMMFKHQIKNFTNYYNEFYFGDMLKTYPKKVAGLIGNMVVVISIVAILLFVLLCFINCYLRWNEAGVLPVEMAINFEDRYIFIQKAGEYTNIIFAAFIAFLLSFFFCCYKRYFTDY